jgi:hypothetical protein
MTSRLLEPLPIEPFSVYGDVDLRQPSGVNVLVADCGVLPPAGRYRGQVRNEVLPSATVEVTATVWPRSPQSAGPRRVTLECPWDASMFSVRVVITFSAALDGAPLAAARAFN